MASNKSAILDIGDDDLQFQTHKFDNVPDSALDNDDDTDALLGDSAPGGGSGGGKKGSYNFLSMGFYQQFFDVDTQDVKNRIVYSMIPNPKSSFLESHIRSKSPDLYGPFWICLTLVFSTAISGNVASYLQTSIQGNSDYQWHYDFHKVTLAATAVFSYAWILPAGIYAYLWYVNNKGALGFLELLCMYGYSLAIYVPVSILWVIQYNALQWFLVLLGAGLSGAVLALSIWPAIRDQANKTAFILIVVVLLLHFALACGFMLYFFHVPGTSVAPIEKEELTPNKNTPENVDGKKDEVEEEKKEPSSSEDNVNKKDDEGGSEAKKEDSKRSSENKEEDKVATKETVEEAENVAPKETVEESSDRKESSYTKEKTNNTNNITEHSPK